MDSDTLVMLVGLVLISFILGAAFAAPDRAVDNIR